MINSQLHAGQIRYHDFPRLRELHQARLRTSAAILVGPSSVVGTTPFRSISTSSWNPFASVSPGSSRWSLLGNNSSSDPQFDADLKKIERLANSQLSIPAAQHEFVARLMRYPDAVVQRFDQTRNNPLDAKLAYLFLSAMQQTQSYSNFRLEDLIRRMEIGDPYTTHLLKQEFTTRSTATGVTNAENKEEAATNSGATVKTTPTWNNQGLSKGEQVRRTLEVLARALASHYPAGTPMASVLGATATSAISGSAGYDASKPLQVRILSNSFGKNATSFALRILIGFVAISAIATLMDEKGVGKALGVTQNGKHIQEAENSNVRFNDVKGVNEPKAELVEIVEFLKDQSRFSRLGGKLPRGLLLIGPPGTGKTLLAKAVAGEAGVPFFYSSGSQFEEVYVGLGARRVRELFEAAKKKAPCIVFIDEIDALGGKRKEKDQAALKMTLNELLVQLDGFEENAGIVVIGATNFSESLDKALLRPGRFDKHVVIDLPDIAGRREILELYANKTKLADDVDLDVLARGTMGMAGADLYNLINQAAVKASVDGLNAINMETLEYAKDKIMMGAEKLSAFVSEKTKRTTAYHEAGHALVAVLTAGAHPIHKATIMPRGNSLGMVTWLRDDDNQNSEAFNSLIATIDMCMGGRVAEELINGEENITSGPYADIKSATNIARRMVSKLGYSDKVGVVHHDVENGRTSIKTRDCIDDEVKRIIDESYQRVKELLIAHQEEHHLLAECLLEYETLTGDEVREIVLHKRKPAREAKYPASPQQTEASKSNSSPATDKNNGKLPTPAPIK